MNKFKDFINRVKSDLDQTTGKLGLPVKFVALIAILYAVVVFFIMLPPLNIFSMDFWIYILSIMILLIVLGGNKIPLLKIRFILIFAIVATIAVVNFFSSEFFRAKSYANIVNVQTGDFTSDIEELPLSQIPTLDRESSEKVGSRKMGELLDLVSQFNIDNMYTQINYKNKPVRVTPLEYNGILKYLTNFRQGLPGYMMIDIVDGSAELIKLDEGIKYSKDDLLFRNIWTYARIKYPFDIMYNMEFEIDDNGVPYWVIPSYRPRIGLMNAKDVSNVILINAITGESQKFSVDETPQWVDRVYNADQIIRQLDWYGMYQNGWFNSRFAQKNVLQTTEGYNYLALHDDIYMYTGFTSVAGDESNVGFILTNMRTKDTKFYPVSSAEEFSAMESSQGAVQEKGYVATFPLLLNIKDKPTYFLSLKDNAGLIKQYAFIDAQDYQKVATGFTVEEAYEKHTGTIIEDSNFDENTEFVDQSGTIESIEAVVINGNTHYYFTLIGDQNIYVSSIKLSEKLPFLKAGDEVNFKYAKTKINEVISFE